MTDIHKRVGEMLKSMSATGRSAGGVKPLLQMLERMDRGSEKQILATLKQQNPMLAKELEKHFFSFEDLVNMDDRVLQRALGEIHRTTLAVALKGTDENIKLKIMKNLSSRAAQMLRDEMLELGERPKSLVDEAQREVTKTLRVWKDVII